MVGSQCGPSLLFRLLNHNSHLESHLFHEAIARPASRHVPLPSLACAGQGERAVPGTSGLQQDPKSLFLPCSLGHRLSGETHAHLILAHLPSLSLGKLSDLPMAEFLRLQPALSPRSTTGPGPLVAGLH